MKMSIKELRPAVAAFNEVFEHLIVNRGSGSYQGRTAADILDEMYPDSIEWHHAAARVIDMGKKR